MIILVAIGYSKIERDAIAATMLNWLKKEPWASPFYASEVAAPEQRIEIFTDCDCHNSAVIEDCMGKLKFDFKINFLKCEVLNPDVPKTISGEGTIDGTPIPKPRDNPQPELKEVISGF